MKLQITIDTDNEEFGKNPRLRPIKIGDFLSRCAFTFAVVMEEGLQQHGVPTLLLNSNNNKVGTVEVIDE